MYTLFANPGTCSLAVHVVLNELAAPFEWVNVSADKAPEAHEQFLKINPLGAVPALKDGELALLEGAAIMLYLCDQHPSPLIPQETFARAKALQWLMFANATLHPTYSRGFFLKKSASHTEEGKALLQTTTDRINLLWEQVETNLEGKSYCAGESLTCADILLTVIANWSKNISGEIILPPKVKALLSKVSKRPSFVAALAKEGVTYSAV